MRLSAKNSVDSVRMSMITDMLVPLPEYKEQQKIAEFLCTVDDKLTNLRRKHELLKNYKRGLMQQLFSQQIRFKQDDGSDFPDWIFMRLGNLTSKVGKKNTKNIQYPIYSISNKKGFVPQSEQFAGMDSNQRGYDIRMYKIVGKGTFAYNPARINVGSIGYSYDLENVIVSSLYVCFKTTKEVSDDYLLQYIDTYNFTKDVLRNAEGGVREYLFYENFSNIKIPLPSLSEQQKITDFLQSIDNNIDAVAKQITQLDAFKKGLLQKLFV